jgi:hypothetical protein
MANWDNIAENEIFTDTDGADNVSRLPLKAGQSNTRFDRGVRKDTALARWNIYTGGGISLRANNQLITKRDIMPLHSLKFNNPVNDCIYHSDGSMMFVGEFTTYDNYSYNRIVLLDANGYVDKLKMNYGDGFNGAVKCVTLMPDNTLWIGGSFSTYTIKGVTITANNFIITNRDMTVNSNFQSGDGINGQVESIKLSGYITPSIFNVCVTGNFYTYKNKGISTNVGFVLRINNDGSFAQSTLGKMTFVSGLPTDTVTNSDGSIYVVGSFGQIAYFDPAEEDTIFVQKYGMLKLTSSMEYANVAIPRFFPLDNQSRKVIRRDFQNYLWVGGAFSEVENTTGVRYDYKGFVVLEADSRIRIQVPDPLIYGTVYDIKFQVDGKVLVVGDWQYSIQRHNPVSSNGTRDTSFPYINQFIPSVPEGRILRTVDAEKTLFSPRIILGGAFGAIRNTSDTANYFTKNAVRLNENGQFQVPW